MKHIIKSKLLLLLSIALLLAGCSGQQRAAGNQIRIGFFPNITHAQALYGKNTGLYEAAFGDEVDLQWLEFNAGPSEIEAMFAGEVDIGYIGPVPAINAYAKSNGDVVVIAGATNAGAILVTRPDLTLTSARELDGLRVAIPQLGNTQHLSLLNILKENDLKTTDSGGTVDVIAAANADIMTLLDQGSIDAALVPEPWGARMVGEIGANILMDEHEVWRDGDYPVALVIVNREFMEANPDLVRIFLETHLAITNEINDNYAESKAIINSELENLTGRALDEDILDQAFSRIIVTVDVNQEAIDGFVDILVSEGFSNPIDDTSSILHLDILNDLREGN